MKRIAAMALIATVQMSAPAGAGTDLAPGETARAVLAEGGYQTELPGAEADRPAPPPQRESRPPDFSPSPSPSSPYLSGGPDAMWVAIAVLAPIVAFVLFNLLRGVRIRRPPDPAGHTSAEVGHNSDEVLLEAERRAAAGDFAGAVRLLLQGILAHMQARGLLSLRDDTTAREALGSFGGDEAARTALARLVAAEEFCLFAGGAAEAQTYADSRRAYLHLARGERP